MPVEGGSGHRPDKPQSRIPVGGEPGVRRSVADVLRGGVGAVQREAATARAYGRLGLAAAELVGAGALFARTDRKEGSKEDRDEPDVKIIRYTEQELRSKTEKKASGKDAEPGR